VKDAWVSGLRIRDYRLSHQGTFLLPKFSGAKRTPNLNLPLEGL
jgi:hypothetical protein